MATTMAFTDAWTLQGQNNAPDGRFHDTSFLAPGASGSAPLTVRDGVLPGSWQSGTVPVELAVTSDSPTASMRVRTWAGSCVISKPSQGPYVGYLNATGQVDLDPADTVNGRYDLVIAEILDSATGDASSKMQLAVITGVPSGSPVVPSIPVGRTGIPLASVFVGANVTQITGANITDLRCAAGLRGAERLMLGGDLHSDAGSYPGDKRFCRTHLQTEVWKTSDNKWHGTQPIVYAKPALNTGLTHLGGAATFTLASLSIPDPGWAYHIEASASCLVRMDDFSATYMTGIYTQLNIDSASFTPPTPATQQLIRTVWTPGESPQQLNTPPVRLKSGTALTGAHTVYYLLRNDSSPSNFLAVEDNEYYTLNVKVIPA